VLCGREAIVSIAQRVSDLPLVTLPCDAATFRLTHSEFSELAASSLKMRETEPLGFATLGGFGPSRLSVSISNTVARF